MSSVPGLGLFVDRGADRFGRGTTSPEPRVLVITGASSGIGRALALEAAASGEHLVLAARGDDSLEEVRRQCVERGALSALVVPTDVGEDDEVAALVQQT